MHEESHAREQGQQGKQLTYGRAMPRSRASGAAAFWIAKAKEQDDAGREQDCREGEESHHSAGCNATD